MPLLATISYSQRFCALHRHEGTNNEALEMFAESVEKRIRDVINLHDLN